MCNWLVILRHTDPPYQCKERVAHFEQLVASKNLRMDTLDDQIARYEEVLSGVPLPPGVRRWLDPEIVIDTEQLVANAERVMKRLKCGGV